MPDLRPLPSFLLGLSILSASTLLPPLLLPSAPTHQMLIAPMMAVADTCVLLNNQQTAPTDLVSSCTQGEHPSASEMITESLQDLVASGQPPSHAYKLGYTLPLPLLSLFEQKDGGQWVINTDLVKRYVNTLEDTHYSAILYLFSNHFSANVPAEKYLAQDSKNLAVSQNGTISVSPYFNTPLYPWSVAKTDNSITEFRVRAINALADEICHRSPSVLKKIHGITLLGETQQMFPNFESAPGFSSPYLISDYSSTSAEQFRNYLKNKFQTLNQLNHALQANYADWSEVAPPSKDVSELAAADISAQRLSHFDAYADGHIPIMGWTYVGDTKAGLNNKILVRLNDQQFATTAINLARPDVLAAHPEFLDNTLGWQTYIDYRNIPSGKYTLEVLLQTSATESPVLLGVKNVDINNPRAARVLHQGSPLNYRPPGENIKYHLDLFTEKSTYVYNPLAHYWNGFRQEQVLDYMRYFSRIIDSSCLKQAPLFLHQIIPHTNPGWDPHKFAIQKTLQPQPRLQLGISLYGPPGLSESFIQNIKTQGHKTYGVTEFHPLQGLSTEKMRETLKMHHDNNASFLSFFIEPRWKQHQIERDNNPFAFTDKNQFMGSDLNYHSVKQVLNEEMRR